MRFANKVLAGFLAALCLTAPAHAIDAGVATGTLEIGGVRMVLTRSFAHLHDNAEGVLAYRKELRILLTDREVAQNAIAGLRLVALQDLVRAGKLQGLLIRLDPADRKILRVSLLQAGPEKQTAWTVQAIDGNQAFKRLAIGRNRVLGAIDAHVEANADPGAPGFDFTVSFSAPLFHEAKVSADLKGKAARDSLQARHWREQDGAITAGRSLKNVLRVVERGNRATLIFADKDFVSLVLERNRWNTE